MKTWIENRLYHLSPWLFCVLRNPPITFRWPVVLRFGEWWWDVTRPWKHGWYLCLACRRWRNDFLHRGSYWQMRRPWPIEKGESPYVSAGLCPDCKQKRPILEPLPSDEEERSILLEEKAIIVAGPQRKDWRAWRPAPSAKSTTREIAYAKAEGKPVAYLEPIAGSPMKWENIIGKWPGDETDEEIRKGLEEIS